MEGGAAVPGAGLGGAGAKSIFWPQNRLICAPKAFNMKISLLLKVLPMWIFVSKRIVSIQSEIISKTVFCHKNMEFLTGQ